MRTRTAVSAVLVGLVLLVVAVSTAFTAAVDRSAAGTSAATATSAAVGLDPSIANAKQRLADVPGDHATWAALGALYVEQARLTADPSLYGAADAALAESLRLRPEANDAALIASGALANARHDFRTAAEMAARGLDVNPYSAIAWGVLTDARTQLGDYAGASQAVGRMLELRPDVASFTRASYDAELHGDVATARSALEQALESATSPADRAFARGYLGELALTAGDLEEAERQFSAGMEDAAEDPLLLMGRAHVAAARGEVELATRTYRQAVQVQPLPSHLVEYGEFLLLVGQEDEARVQFDRARDSRNRFAAHGVLDQVDAAIFEADHGDPLAAVAAARSELDRRQNVEAHDALAWALHSTGQDAEALGHAQAATALEAPDARFLYHRGVIEAALARDDEARTSLTAALAGGPSFSLLHGPRAERLLAELGGPA
ncbi:MAG TPA: tetratricopeptide repeat protein [Blastococcus sp.]|nr:tetratricopeptide repeat protein [Blastococcus sp.]